MDFQTSCFNQSFVPKSDPRFKAIFDHYRCDENQVIQNLLSQAHIDPQTQSRITAQAEELVKTVRQERLKEGGLDAFMYQYDLSSEEGIALMCMAEALLRIPDNKNIDNLIKDKLAYGDWEAHVGKSHSLFVNAATWALMLTGKVLKPSSNDTHFTEQVSGGLSSALKKLASKGGEPVVRKAIVSAMKILSRQFVMGRTIKEAIKRSKPYLKKGYSYSYDMLGEAAYTQEDAQKYFTSYQQAIQAIGHSCQSEVLNENPGISVKLTALHPRFEYGKKNDVHEHIWPKLKALAVMAKEANIGFTIDAEESDSLILALELMARLIQDEDLQGFDGLGMAVQSYQKRAPYVIDWLIEHAKKHHRKLNLRLVKGAYWDTEIKHAQVHGFDEYPVFTRKSATDLSFYVCAKKLFQHTDVIYPQFATHNAYSLSVILELSRQMQCQHFEFQCLHGMGETLYNELLSAHKTISCRIYAPVGTHEELLAYLVRRLLENGANTSFVNRIVNEHLPMEALLQDPAQRLMSLTPKRHPEIPLPQHIYGSQRENSRGIDWSDPYTFYPIVHAVEYAQTTPFLAKPTTQVQASKENSARLSPCDGELKLGSCFLACQQDIQASLESAQRAFTSWKTLSVEKRIAPLKRFAHLMHDHRESLLYLLVFEGGKTLDDATNELREAIDFCLYYAQQAQKLFQEMSLQGPTGEQNQLSLHPRGVIACISPWNFPLAIFVGQVAAALASGNCVIAKPASQTPLIADFAVKLCHQAGFPKEVVQCLPAKGHDIQEFLLKDHRVNGVMFTGSTETAQRINVTLAQRPGPIIPFVAETGGQNCMIVDSTALAEQVVGDIIQSAFKSTGQRCSALRVLYLQEEVADKIIHMLKGAMDELTVGHPMALSTDIGPVIDQGALKVLTEHQRYLDTHGQCLKQVSIDNAPTHGYYFGPMAWEISDLEILKEEVFGPILHIIRFKRSELHHVIEAINHTGYGLTLGIHSRIEDTVEYIRQRVNVGNMYVNRNMVGAVVGVQPFGGEGLSGTGPKAGGPHYLLRLVTERTLTVNTTATGGNASLLALANCE